jgi:hypothetical protein
MRAVDESRSKQNVKLIQLVRPYRKADTYSNYLSFVAIHSFDLLEFAP